MIRAALRILGLILTLMLSSLLTGCTHSLHISHVSDFSPTMKSYAAGELVKVKKEQFVVMGFVQDTNYVDQAYRDLKTSCPGGSVQGITSQYSTSHGFFSWTHYLEMQGLCVR